MARSKSDISNAAIRMFLQEVGRVYDQARGFEQYKSGRSQKQDLLTYFENTCCYCGASIDLSSMSEDHMIPINKTDLGLHCWGNVVPSCGNCNKTKHLKHWEQYLEKVCGRNKKEYSIRHSKLLAFVEKYRYQPDIHLQHIASDLYEDVGEVASTLIRLRLKQAEDLIQKTHNERS